MPISGRRRRLGALARKAAVAMLVVAGAGSAAARGVAVDTVLPNAVTGCTLGASCSPSNLGGAYDLGNYFGATPVSAFTTGPFSNIYIYADGVISIGAPLPSTASVAGGLASLGSGNYIAAGLGDYSALDEQVLVSVLPAPEAPGPDISPEELRIYWTFDLPAGQTTLDPTGGQNAIFGIDMMYEGGGKYLVDVNYGASTSSWYSNPSTGIQYTDNSYCDLTCDPSGADNPGLSDGDFVTGVFLPNGTAIGSSYPGAVGPATVNADYLYPGYMFTIGAASAVPEPATWALAILGLGAVGWRLRRREGRPQFA